MTLRRKVQPSVVRYRRRDSVTRRLRLGAVLALLCALGSGTPVQGSEYGAASLADTPAAPGYLIANAAWVDEIDLFWADNSDDETAFRIYRCEGAGCAPVILIGTVGADSESFIDSGLSQETTYRYLVVASNESGDSSPSNIAEAAIPRPPAAPTGLTATAIGPNEVLLRWIDNADNETRVEITRTSWLCAYCPLAELDGGDITSYTDYPVTPESTYTYTVTVSNVGGAASSNEASVTTPPLPPPGTPTNLSASSVSASQIDLTWTDNAEDEDGFVIERCVVTSITCGGADFAYLTHVGANVTSYANTGLDPSTTYRYRVEAYRSLTHSTYSNEAEATTASPAPPSPPPSTPPIAPSGLAVTGVTKTSASLSWTDTSSDEDGLRVYRCTGAGCTPATLIATLPPDAQSYTDNGLSRRTTYRFRVTAFNEGGESAPSNTATATTR